MAQNSLDYNILNGRFFHDNLDYWADVLIIFFNFK